MRWYQLVSLQDVQAQSHSCRTGDTTCVSGYVCSAVSPPYYSQVRDRNCPRYSARLLTAFSTSAVHSRLCSSSNVDDHEFSAGANRGFDFNPYSTGWWLRFDYYDAAIQPLKRHCCCCWFVRVGQQSVVDSAQPHEQEHPVVRRLLYAE